MAVVTSIMLYDCPILSETFSVRTTRRILTLVYRLSAIRLINGFRIVSDEAILALAKTTQRDILAGEIRSIYLRHFE